MNWGWKLALVYTTFVGLMLMLVFKSKSAKIDLVRTDYYEAEIAHQSQMEATSNAQNLSSAIKMSTTSGGVELILPSECFGTTLSGNVHVYRPSDVNLDKTLPIQLNEQSTMLIPGSEFTKGLYVFKVTWEMNGKSYYSEESFFVE
jgi:hypothetical protein